MKVALCLSGLPRCLETSYVFHKHYIIDKFKHVDVFIHTWDIDHGGYRLVLNNQIPTSPCHNKTVSDYITDDIKPVSFIVDSYETFSQTYGKESTPAMYYSIQKANELKTKNEIEKSFKYDLVIRSRMDFIFCSSIPINEINTCDNKLFVALNRDKNNLHPNLDNCYTDMFAFSSSDLMNIYSNSFETWVSNKNLRSESVLTTHLNNNSVNVTYSDIKLMLMEKYTLNKWEITYHNKRYDE